jgi:hypothetical protein
MSALSTALSKRKFKSAKVVLVWRVAPSKSIAQDEDDAAQDQAIINTRYAVGQWEIPLDTEHLRFR